MKNLGETISNLRKNEGLSQKALAEALNISVKTVSHWETGYTEPSAAQLVMIADFFDVSLDELLGRK